MEESVQLVTDVKLPSLIKRQLQQQAAKFLDRHRPRFGFARINLHLKHDGPQIACNLNMITDDGRYNAYVAGWDVRTTLMDALECIDVQVNKHVAKAAAM